ncbi:MAG TPA: CHAD domain-containing protein [Polyangiaceae bacterium]|nr:CHAD domain-containing protein [Polyangiaceae bacterium]
MTLSAYVKPRLLGLSGDLARAVPRVVAGDDGEAVHDLRVALRKLRSVLRVVRRLYGRFHTDAVRAGLKRVADATGALRDEEVLAETLAGLDLSPRAGEALAAWLRDRHARRGRKLRKEVVALVSGGALDPPLAMLGALLTLPVDPARDKPAARFARKIVFSALDDIELAQPVDPADVEKMHDLRILYKRLRYAVDAFEGVLPPEFAALERAAAAFQKRLGTIHDLDVALDVVEGAEGLPPEARGETLDALSRERARQVDKYERERARGRARERAVEARPAHDDDGAGGGEPAGRAPRKPSSGRKGRRGGKAKASPGAGAARPGANGNAAARPARAAPAGEAARPERAAPDGAARVAASRPLARARRARPPAKASSA